MASKPNCLTELEAHFMRKRIQERLTYCSLIILPLMMMMMTIKLRGLSP
jgi:hypothetical protein